MHTFAGTNFSDEEFKDTKISGFLTAGFARGGNKRLGLRQNIAQFGKYADWTYKTDSLLGLQLNQRFSKKWDAAFQAIFKDRVGDNLEDNIEWAFVRYAPTPYLDMRVGRIGLDVFMLSDHRNVGFAYLWARPPIEFYGAFGFDHFHGADIEYSTPLYQGNFSTKVFVGKARYRPGVPRADLNIRLEPFYGFNIKWEDFNWRFQFAYADIKYPKGSNEESGFNELVDNLEFAESFGWQEAGDIIDTLNIDNERTQYYALGASFENRRWIIQSEAAYTYTTFETLKPYINYYLSAGYKYQQTIGYVMVGHMSNTKDVQHLPEPPPIPNTPGLPVDLLQASLDELVENVDRVYHTARIDQTTYTLGLRWNLRYDTAIKLQWDRSHVKALGQNLWITEKRFNYDSWVNTYTVNLNFVF
ncbi:MAG: hypothetical protein MI867_20725 [Pseudomonadales bacterium]|nr:hypothetical protein [Pseudomonadales bacterium]